jgi:hypothetical protein
MASQGLHVALSNNNRSSSTRARSASVLGGILLLVIGILGIFLLEDLLTPDNSGEQYFGIDSLDLGGGLSTDESAMLPFGDPTKNGGYAPGDSGDRYVRIVHPNPGYFASLTLSTELVGLVNPIRDTEGAGPNDTPAPPPADFDSLGDISIEVSRCPVGAFDPGTGDCEAGWDVVVAPLPMNQFKRVSVWRGPLTAGPDTVLRLHYQVSNDPASGDRLQGTMATVRFAWTVVQNEG